MRFASQRKWNFHSLLISSPGFGAARPIFPYIQSSVVFYAILCIKCFVYEALNGDGAKIIPPCHVNEHIIFDLVPRAIFRVCVCVCKFFFLHILLLVYMYISLFSLVFLPLLLLLLLLKKKITHGNKVFE